MDEQLLVDFFSEEKKHWWHIAKRSLIKQFIKGKNLNILVAGVGGGMICEELMISGHYVVGMDISGAACEYVNKKMGIKIIKGDLEKPLPFAKGFFDLIILADILEHLDNDNQLLAEALRCLKPQGSVIITVPAYSHMWSLWDRRLHHKRRYSLATIKMKVNEAGLRVYKASYYHTLLYPFAYIYRIILRLPKGGCQEKSDFGVFPNKLGYGFFSFYYVLERFLLKIINLPFGLSIFVVGIKHG